MIDTDPAARSPAPLDPPPLLGSFLECDPAPSVGSLAVRIAVARSVVREEPTGRSDTLPERRLAAGTLSKTRVDARSRSRLAVGCQQREPVEREWLDRGSPRAPVYGGIASVGQVGRRLQTYPEFQVGVIG